MEGRRRWWWRREGARRVLLNKRGGKKISFYLEIAKMLPIFGSFLAFFFALLSVQCQGKRIFNG